MIKLIKNYNAMDINSSTTYFDLKLENSTSYEYFIPFFKSLKKRRNLFSYPLLLEKNPNLLLKSGYDFPTHTNYLLRYFVIDSDTTSAESKAYVNELIDESCSNGQYELSQNASNSYFERHFYDTYTNEFINLITNEDFELGYTSKSELLFTKLMNINLLAARNWLNSLFMDYYSNNSIIIGIIRLIGRYNPEEIYPQGQTMALASLCSSSDEIIEWGIRAFENWGGVDSIRILENTRIKTKWLDDYRLQVIKDIQTIKLHE